MSTWDPEDLRARFLAVLPVQRVAITATSDAGVRDYLGASDDVAEQMEWAQITLGEGAGAGIDAAESD